MKKKIIIGITLLSLIIYNLLPQSKLKSGVIIDKIVVLKSKRQLLAYSCDTLIKTYKISLGRNPIGAKEFEGDKKTPEGLYYINDKNPKSAFHRNLGISYPNELDIKLAKTLGKSPGGEIKIHGLRNGLGFMGKFHRLIDWTSGCIAMTNSEIEEIYNNTPIGTTIEIKK